MTSLSDVLGSTVKAADYMRFEVKDITIQGGTTGLKVKATGANKMCIRDSGKNGEDGTIQGLFELSGIPYVGCDHMSSAICMDKEMAHIVMENAGIPCAPYL